MKVLVAGDSFAADWTSQFPQEKGWVNLLCEKFDVTNVAQAGCSEYKILQQIKSTYIPEKFDAVVVAHTSPYRLYTPKSPVNYKDNLHQDCDLIYSDVRYHASLLKNKFNQPLRAALGFFKYHYSEDYCDEIYLLLRHEISRILSDIKVITIATPIVDTKFIIENCVIKLNQSEISHGNVNHLTPLANLNLYSKVCNELQ